MYCYCQEIPKTYKLSHIADFRIHYDFSKNDRTTGMNYEKAQSTNMYPLPFCIKTCIGNVFFLTDIAFVEIRSDKHSSCCTNFRSQI